MTPADRLISTYPEAWRFFAKTPELFANALAVGDVFENDSCWVFLEGGNGDTRTLHWFCPEGAKLPALRRILLRIFLSGVETIVGEQSPKHLFRREARALARALGAETHEGKHVLTFVRFVEYNRGKPGFSEE